MNFGGEKMSKLIKQQTFINTMLTEPFIQDENNTSNSTIVEIFEYNENEYSEVRYVNEEIKNYKFDETLNLNKIKWINVDGLSNLELIENIENAFKIHSLVIEDILNTKHRAKIESYDKYLYIVVKMVYFLNNNLITEQLSIIVGKGYIISFGEKEGDAFDIIRDRIRKDGTRLRKTGADFLAYSLLDAIVDGYFLVLERLGDEIDTVEEELVNKPSLEGLNHLRQLRKDLLYMHKSIWPLREVAVWLQRDENDLITSSTQIYVRDVYDHIIQAIDNTETFRELLSGLMDIYLSSISNKLNEVMKVLTIISTIFIPLTFISSIYGMNFKFMPELGWKLGYGAVMLEMTIIAIGMVMYFKRKKWF